jgi:hypothetical protein
LANIKRELPRSSSGKKIYRDSIGDPIATLKVAIGSPIESPLVELLSLLTPIRAPETVFALEELRERKVFSYANQIQLFFLKFSLNTYYYDMQMAANNQVRGKKERRRLSLDRPFKGDYINYRENFPLKAVIEVNGKEKVAFADRINKLNKSLKKNRRVMVLTSTAVSIP